MCSELSGAASSAEPGAVSIGSDHASSQDGSDNASSQDGAGRPDRTELRVCTATACQVPLVKGKSSQDKVVLGAPFALPNSVQSRPLPAALLVTVQ